MEFGTAEGVRCESCWEDEQEIRSQRPYILYESIPGHAPKLVAVIDTQGFTPEEMNEVDNMLQAVKDHRNMTNSHLPTYTIREATDVMMVTSGMMMTQVLDDFLSKMS